MIDPLALLLASPTDPLARLVAAHSPWQAARRLYEADRLAARLVRSARSTRRLS